MRPTINQIFIGIAVVLAAFFAMAEPIPSQSETALRHKIMALDKAFFNAFNTCDLETWKSYLDENIEFYQDNDSTLRRELLPDTVEVHPIQGFGAVQFGTHRFWKVAAGEPDQLMATPRFVHLWRHKDGVWQITRVISYGH